MQVSHRRVNLALVTLLAVQSLLIAFTVHRESLTWDEGHGMKGTTCMRAIACGRTATTA